MENTWSLLVIHLGIFYATVKRVMLPRGRQTQQALKLETLAEIRNRTKFFCLIFAASLSFVFNAIVPRLRHFFGAFYGLGV